MPEQIWRCKYCRHIWAKEEDAEWCEFNHKQVKEIKEVSYVNNLSTISAPDFLIVKMTNDRLYKYCLAEYMDDKLRIRAIEKGIHYQKLKGSE